MKRCVLVLIPGLVLCGWGATSAAQSPPVAQSGPPAPMPAARASGQACTLFAPNSRLNGAAQDAMLLNAYNDQAHAIRSLFVAAMVTPGSGTGAPGDARPAKPLPALIQVVKPDLIRVTGPSRLSGDRGFEMASDGQEFHLLIPEDGRKVFVVGPPDATVPSGDLGARNLREDIRPQPFFDALLWPEGRLIGDPAQPTGGATHPVRVELPPGRGGARSATIDFDLANGVMQSISGFDASGRLLFQAQYGRWEEIETLSRQPLHGCFPREIHLVRPGDDLFLDLRITQIDLNPEIARSSFRMSTPKNIPVIYVDKSGKTITKP